MGFVFIAIVVLNLIFNLSLVALSIIKDTIQNCKNRYTEKVNKKVQTIEEYSTLRNDLQVISEVNSEEEEESESESEDEKVSKIRPERRVPTSGLILPET